METGNQNGTPPVEQEEVVIEEKKGFQEVSDAELQEHFEKTGRLDNRRRVVPTVEQQEPIKPEAKVEPPVSTVVQTTDDEYIKIPKASLPKGIFEGDVSSEAILNRLSQAGINLSEDDKKALDTGKRILGRPDIQNLVEYAERPTANLKHYADVVSMKVEEMSAIDKIVAYRSIKEGINADKLRTALEYDYMLLPKDEYSDLSDRRYESMVASAGIKMGEEAAAASAGLLKIQQDLRRPVEEVSRENAVQVNKDKRIASEASWVRPLQDIASGIDIQVPLKYKDSAGAEIELPFTFDFLKPERKTELAQYAKEYLDVMLSYNPDFQPTETTIKEAQTAAANRYLISHRTEIINQAIQDAVSDAEFRLAKAKHNPKETTLVVDTNRQQTSKGYVEVSPEEVAEERKR